MPITVNEGGTLYELDTVTSNEGGTLYELDTIYSNEGGALYEIYSSANLVIYADTANCTINRYDTGIEVTLNSASGSENYNIYFVPKGIKTGDTITMVCNYLRASSWTTALLWQDASSVTSELNYEFHISQGYIDIYGSEFDFPRTVFTASSKDFLFKINHGADGSDYDDYETAKPLKFWLYSVKINDKELISKPYYNYFSEATAATITKGNSKYDKSELLKNFAPVSDGFEYELSIDPGGKYDTTAVSSVIMVANKMATATVIKGTPYYTTGGQTSTGGVNMTVGSTVVSDGNTADVSLISGSQQIKCVSDFKTVIVTGSQSGTTTTTYPWGYKATYKLKILA